MHTLIPGVVTKERYKFPTVRIVNHLTRMILVSEYKNDPRHYCKTRGLLPTYVIRLLTIRRYWNHISLLGLKMGKGIPMDCIYHSENNRPSSILSGVTYTLAPILHKVLG